MSTRYFLRLVGTTALVVTPVLAQFRVSGQATAEFFKSENGVSQYTVDEGRSTFAWRWDLFADAAISDHVAFLSNIRMLQDQVLHIDRLSIRVSDVASSGIAVEAGQIDIPFGDLGDRRFPQQNPFFDLPLMNEHITTLCKTDYKLWVLFPGFAVSGNGVRLLDQGLYDLGIKAYGSAGMFGYEAALINGMVSETGTYSPNGMNVSGGLGKVLRLTVTPTMGLTFGFSYAFGPFMKDQYADSGSALAGEHPGDYPQQAAAGDVDIEIGHLSVRGIGVYNRWRYIGGQNLDAVSYSAEAQYTLTPRIYAAARVGGIQFNTINALVTSYNFRPAPFSGRWDDNVTRVELAAGYRIERNLLFKLCYEINNSYGISGNPMDNVLGVQTVLTF